MGEAGCMSACGGAHSHGAAAVLALEPQTNKAERVVRKARDRIGTCCDD